MSEDTDMVVHDYERLCNDYNNAKKAARDLNDFLKSMGFRTVRNIDTGIHYDPYIEKNLRTQQRIMLRGNDVRAIATLSTLEDPNDRRVHTYSCSLELEYKNNRENIGDFMFLRWDLQDELGMC
ncbi:MAG: hypothetical protein ABIG93_03460 [archaeon]|nr:hypothetical protein [Nanoarchaeota archaeon]